MARSYDSEAPMPTGDSMHEECGVTGVFAPGADVARLAYFGLYALQHRGQESAGIAVSDGEHLSSHRDMGLIGGIFDEDILGTMKGDISVGHTRYSTSGSSIMCNAQPFIEDTNIGQFAYAHNGNLTNSEALLAMLPADINLVATSDSEILSKTIALAEGETMVERIKAAMRVAEGAYSVVMATKDAIYAFRDPWGVRPLCIGTYGDDGYMVASESCALATVGAQYLREIEAGEIVVIDKHGLRTEHTEVVKPPALCMFEYIYFARPDSVLSGRSIYMARYQMGKALAREHPVRPVFCTVIDTASMLRPEADLAFDPMPVMARMRADARVALDLAVQHASAADNHPDIEIASATDVASGMIDVAHHYGADAIVVGTHRRSSLQRFFIGSTAQDILQNSDVPVIVVPVDRSTPLRSRERSTVAV